MCSLRRLPARSLPAPVPASSPPAPPALVSVAFRQRSPTASPAPGARTLRGPPRPSQGGGRWGPRCFTGCRGCAGAFEAAVGRCRRALRGAVPAGTGSLPGRKLGCEWSSSLCPRAARGANPLTGFVNEPQAASGPWAIRDSLFFHPKMSSCVPRCRTCWLLLGAGGTANVFVAPLAASRPSAGACRVAGAGTFWEGFGTPGLRSQLGCWGQEQEPTGTSPSPHRGIRPCPGWVTLLWVWPARPHGCSGSGQGGAGHPLVTLSPAAPTSTHLLTAAGRPGCVLALRGWPGHHRRAGTAGTHGQQHPWVVGTHGWWGPMGSRDRRTHGGWHLQTVGTHGQWHPWAARMQRRWHPRTAAPMGSRDPQRGAPPGSQGSSTHRQLSAHCRCHRFPSLP